MRYNRQYFINIAKYLEKLTPEQLQKYFDNENVVLDLEYACNYQGNYLGAKIYLVLGGPNIWYDTRKNSLILEQGANREEYFIKTDTADQIDELFEQRYNTRIKKA